MRTNIKNAIKLLMLYNLTSTEISYQLNFSCEEEFVSQFKLITGLTPDDFKQLKTQNVKGNVLVNVE